MIDPAALMFSTLFLAMLVRMTAGRCCCVVELGNDCATCDTDTTPLIYMCDFTGVVNDNCDECGDYNDTTWALEQQTGVFATGCAWDVESPPCAYLSGILLQRRGAPINDMYLQVSNISAKPDAAGSASMTIPEDCRRSLTIEMENIDPWNFWCNWDDATAEVYV